MKRIPVPAIEHRAAFSYRKRKRGPMMSRPGSYNQQRLMSNIDTDLDALSLESPPSPPPHLQMDNSASDEDRDLENQNSNRHGDNPPETPYYDYACSFLFGGSLIV